MPRNPEVERRIARTAAAAHPVRTATDLARARARLVAGEEERKAWWPPREALEAAVAGMAEGLAAANRCQCCGRPLENPTSLARQVGPDCWAKGYRAEGVDWHDPEAPQEPATAAHR